MSARTKTSRPTVSLSVEQLENRELLKSGPFDTTVFHAEIRQLMRSNDLPQISLTARIDSRHNLGVHPQRKRRRRGRRSRPAVPTPDESLHSSGDRGLVRSTQHVKGVETASVQVQ
jgi:hypothetical protein